jgi:predicted alternative tryptophan synthase beta-subunit
LNSPSNDFLATNNRVQLPLSSELSQIFRILLQVISGRDYISPSDKTEVIERQITYLQKDQPRALCLVALAEKEGLHQNKSELHEAIGSTEI